MSDSLQSHGLQHTRLLCPSPIPRTCSNSSSSSWWCYSIISSSVVPVSSCLQSFPASGSIQMSQFFTSDGQSIGASASASVLPMNIQDWFPLGLTVLILQSKGLSRVFSNTTVQKHQFFCTRLPFLVQLFVTPWTAARQASLSITNSRSLLKLMSIEAVMPSNHLIFCCPLLLLPSIFPSIRVFSNE